MVEFFFANDAEMIGGGAELLPSWPSHPCTCSLTSPPPGPVRSSSPHPPPPKSHLGLPVVKEGPLPAGGGASSSGPGGSWCLSPPPFLGRGPVQRWEGVLHWGPGVPPSCHQGPPGCILWSPGKSKGLLGRGGEGPRHVGGTGSSSLPDCKVGGAGGLRDPCCQQPQRRLWKPFPPTFTKVTKRGPIIREGCFPHF